MVINLVLQQYTLHSQSIVAKISLSTSCRYDPTPP